MQALVIAPCPAASATNTISSKYLASVKYHATMRSFCYILSLHDEQVQKELLLIVLTPFVCTLNSGNNSTERCNQKL